MKLLRFNRTNFLANRSSNDPVGRLHAELQRLLELSNGEFGSQFFNVWAPVLDVHEDKENLVVTLEVPGLKKEDFEIALHDGVLSIAGERRLQEKPPKAAGFRSERFEGRFQRSVNLPKAVDAEKVQASYRDGILTVLLPIAASARPRQILIGAE